MVLLLILTAGTLLCGIPSRSLAQQDRYEEGVAAYMRGDTEKALKDFRDHLKENPHHEPAEQWIEILKSLGPEKGIEPVAGTKKVPIEVSSSEEEPKKSEIIRLKSELDDLKRKAEADHRLQVAQLEEVSRILSETDRNLALCEDAREAAERKLTR